MKRVLIISTTFFPDPKVAAIRMTQWCRHLPEQGWAPRVLCRHYGFEATPQSLAEHVHPQVRVEYLNSTPRHPSMYARGSLVGRARGMVARAADAVLVPDTSIRFWRSARYAALRRVEQDRPDLILTTSPANSTHDLGFWLSRQTGIPWVADFRDVYLIDFAWRYGVIARCNLTRHERFERSIYENAALVIHAIPLHARWATRRYPFARRRICMLPNGCPAELAEGRVEPVTTAGPRRSVRVIGSIGEADVLRLAYAVAELVREGDDLELCCVGRIPGNATELHELLGDRIRMTGYVSHPDALREVAGASVLVSCLSGHRQRYGLSSKLFEFIAAGKPVLEVNPSVPDRQLLRTIPGVQMLDDPTPEAWVASIRRALSGDGIPQETAVRFRQKFNRAEQARRLANWFNQVVT